MSELSQLGVMVSQDPILVFRPVDYMLDSDHSILDQCRMVQARVLRTIQQGRIEAVEALLVVLFHGFGVETSWSLTRLFVLPLSPFDYKHLEKGVILLITVGGHSVFKPHTLPLPNSDAQINFMLSFYLGQNSGSQLWQF